MKKLILITLLITACGPQPEYPNALHQLVSACSYQCRIKGYDFDYQVTKRNQTESYCQCKVINTPDSTCIDIQVVGSQGSIVVPMGGAQ